MAKATKTMDLAGVSAFIERWWRVAWSAAHPAEHRAMLEHADQLLAGEALPTTSWAETRSSLGLQVYKVESDDEAGHQVAALPEDARDRQTS